MGPFLLKRYSIPILIFPWFVELPAFIFLGIWIIMQFFNATAGQGVDGIAWWAHIGGFVVGSILCLPTFIRLGGLRFWKDSSGHPPHPEAEYTLVKSAIPKVKSRLGKKSPWS